MVGRVRIEDAWSSASVELEPVRYQFPDYEPRPGKTYDEWDANWLQIRGQIVTPEISWSFTDPCLTTLEAAELGRWLVDVAEGKVRPSDETFGRGGAFFTEPNLSARLAATDGDLRTLIWYFSQESAPPGASDEVRFGFGHPVQIALTAAELLRAAAEWAAELDRFPTRAAE